MTKIFSSPEAAVADIPDGSTIAIAGFGVGHSYPNSLVIALKDHGVRDLCIVANSLGAGEYRPELLLENGQVSRVVLSFSARPGFPSLVEQRAAEGTVKLEMVPQGILVERLRAAGAGLPAFYSPVTVGTPLAQGKELREFDGKPYVLEKALPVDYALVRGFRADANGNVEFRGSSMHFHPSFAKGARVAIVEVEEIVEAGAIPPERVGLPGIFVARVVLTTKKMAVPKGAMRRRAPDSRRDYFGKPALSRMEFAQRARHFCRKTVMSTSARVCRPWSPRILPAAVSRCMPKTARSVMNCWAMPVFPTPTSSTPRAASSKCVPAAPCSTAWCLSK